MVSLAIFLQQISAQMDSEQAVILSDKAYEGVTRMPLIWSSDSLWWAEQPLSSNFSGKNLRCSQLTDTVSARQKYKPAHLFLLA